jgi:hypothetical protein
VESVFETFLAYTKCRYHHLVLLVNQYRFIIQTRRLNTTFMYLLFYNTFVPLYSAISRQKHKYIIGKVYYARGVCRFAAKISVRRDVNSVAAEGRLLDKNGVSRCRVGSYFTLCNENQLDALFILSLFRPSTFTCFGHICSPSSGGILYIYNNWYVLC